MGYYTDFSPIAIFGKRGEGGGKCTICAGGGRRGERGSRGEREGGLSAKKEKGYLQLKVY